MNLYYLQSFVLWIIVLNFAFFSLGRTSSGEPEADSHPERVAKSNRLDKNQNSDRRTRQSLPFELRSTAQRKTGTSGLSESVISRKSGNRKNDLRRDLRTSLEGTELFVDRRRRQGDRQRSRGSVHRRISAKDERDHRESQRKSLDHR